MSVATKSKRISNMVEGLIKARNNVEAWKGIIYGSEFWKAFENSIASGMFTPIPCVDDTQCVLRSVTIDKMWAVYGSSFIGASVIMTFREMTYQYDHGSIDINQTIDISINSLNRFDLEEFKIWEAKFRDANIKSKLYSIKNDIDHLVKQFSLSKSDIIKHLL